MDRNEKVSDDIKNRVKIKGRQFRIEAMNDKKMKLIKLKESLDVTPVCDDDKVPAAHKPKQKRKWIKKSKYQRLQKRKKKEKTSVVFNYSKVF